MSRLGQIVDGLPDEDFNLKKVLARNYPDFEFVVHPEQVRGMPTLYQVFAKGQHLGNVRENADGTTNYWIASTGKVGIRFHLTKEDAAEVMWGMRNRTTESFDIRKLSKRWIPLDFEPRSEGIYVNYSGHYVGLIRNQEGLWSACRDRNFVDGLPSKESAVEQLVVWRNEDA